MKQSGLFQFQHVLRIDFTVNVFRRFSRAHFPVPAKSAKDSRQIGRPEGASFDEEWGAASVVPWSALERLHFEAEIHFEHILQKLHFSSFMEIRFKMFSSFHSTETLLQVKDRPAHLGPADASVSTVEELLKTTTWYRVWPASCKPRIYCGKQHICADTVLALKIQNMWSAVLDVILTAVVFEVSVCSSDHWSTSAQGHRMTLFLQSTHISLCLILLHAKGFFKHFQAFPHSCLVTYVVHYSLSVPQAGSRRGGRSCCRNLQGINGIIASARSSTFCHMLQ